MDVMHSFAISEVGLTLERARVEVASVNLANANTAGVAGNVYKPLRVITKPGGLTFAPSSFGTMVDSGLSHPYSVVQAEDVMPRKLHEPGHPMADADGYVHYANVDPLREMMTLMSAMRSYEANLAAISAARSLAIKSLEIGGR